MPREAELVVDDGEDGGFYEYPADALSSIRSRRASDWNKARSEKYGSGRGRDDGTRPEGGNRVEKAIRIRIRWSCHECHTSFTGRKTCANCGHRRCSECAKKPAGPVKDAVAGTQLAEDIDRKIDSANEDDDSIAMPVTTDGPTRTAAGLPPSSGKEPLDPTVAKEIKADDDAGGETAESRFEGDTDEDVPEMDLQGTLEQEKVDEDGDIEVTQYECTMQTRPTAGFHVILRPKHKYLRTACHECKTAFTPASKRKCLSCNHDRCDQCSRHTAKPEQREEETTDGNAPAEQRMSGTVDRVYRKTRLRVKWRCHECQASFVRTTKCANCGHTKCDRCTRTPLVDANLLSVCCLLTYCRLPKSPVAEPDSEVMASLTEKLAKFEGPLAVEEKADEVVVKPAVGMQDGHD